jgi:hypothetical protein
VPKKKNQPKPPTEKIDFPVEDQGWIALQSRIIELAGKPVEDLEWDGVEKISQQLAPPEQETFRRYWFRLKQEQEKSSPTPSPSKPSTGVPKWKNWEDVLCNKTFEWMVDFQHTMRAVLFRLQSISHEQLTDSYAEVLDAIKKELIESLEPDVLWEPEKGNTIITFLGCNISGILPTDEGNKLLQSFFDRLKARENELKQQRAMAIPVSPVPSAPTAAPSPKLESKPEPKEEERMTMAEAFTINDEPEDDERAIRAARLLLEWAAQCGNRTVDGFLVIGICRALDMAADGVARTARRVELERQKSR